VAAALDLDDLGDVLVVLLLLVGGVGYRLRHGVVLLPGGVISSGPQSGLSVSTFASVHGLSFAVGFVLLTALAKAKRPDRRSAALLGSGLRHAPTPPVALALSHCSSSCSVIICPFDGPWTPHLSCVFLE
jgi:hypothetical protein